MPVVGEFHRFFWSRHGTAPAPPPVTTRPGYPMWQASVILPSLFGIIGARWDAFLEQVRWWYALYRRIKALPPTSHLVLLTVLRSLEHPAYPAAKQAVRATAITERFNRPESWLEYSRAVKSSPHLAENMYRHLRAMTLVRTEHPALTNPEQNLLVELAYAEYAVRPWKT